MPTRFLILLRLKLIAGEPSPLKNAGVDAKGDIHFDNATNSTTKTATGYNGEASAKGGTTPEGKNIHIDLGGGYHTDSKNRN
ncbi:hypothetical protein QPK13_20005 [Photorhabdus tasmaniensis]|uniref:hypothetical protein n=1 Tax=Photorhabdus sp. RM323S TaxID=3342828 RepID=UPI0036D98FBA